MEKDLAQKIEVRVKLFLQEPVLKDSQKFQQGIAKEAEDIVFRVFPAKVRTLNWLAASRTFDKDYHRFCQYISLPRREIFTEKRSES